MPVESHPLSPVASAIYDMIAERIGYVAGSFWMFNANATLGNVSPIQAIKAGRIDDVKRAILMEERRREV